MNEPGFKRGVGIVDQDVGGGKTSKVMEQEGRGRQVLKGWY